MLIFDVFKGQITPHVRNVITENDCVYVFVPNNHTNEFQPLDLTVNGPAKVFLSGKFQEWYAKEITKQIEGGTCVYSVKVNINLSIMKPLHAQWVIGLYDFLRNKPDVVRKGFELTGITDAILMKIENRRSLH